MKYLLIILNLIFIGCASQKMSRNLSENSVDGLRYESLNRYDYKRLELSKHAQKGIALCHKGEYNKAYSTFKNQLDKNINNPIYWNHLATCYLLENKLTQAKFYYNLALRTVKKNIKIKATIMNNLGLYYLKLQENQMAMESFNASIKLYQGFKTAQFNLAQVYLKFSNFNKAEKILNSLYKSSPRDIDFIYGLGHLNLMQGKYKKSNYFFSLIPKKYISRDDIATNYAMSLHLSGNNQQAYKLLKGAQMNSTHYIFAQTELIKKIERTNQK